ncbi:MAG: TIGR02206 family membrane protein [Eubacteriales bacterium]
MDISWFYEADAATVTPYSAPHVLYLLVCFYTIYQVVKHRKMIAEKKDTCRKIAFGVILFQQVVLLYGWYYFMTGFDITVSLPLHICRIASLLALIFICTEDTRLMDVIFYFSVFALTSFFYPLDVYNFAHVNGISYMINHLMTVLTPICAAIIYKWRPTWAGYRRGVICFTIYFVTVYILNPIIGSNYFYLVNRPFGNGFSYDVYCIGSYLVTVSGYGLITALFTMDHAAARKQIRKIINRQDFLGHH